MNAEAQSILDDLLEGNRRFREGKSREFDYGPDRIAELAAAPEPRAAILACSDSRVSPEIVFDQPLGTLFISRVPGNVCSDSAKWMLELAVTNLQVPLVLVMGHTECLAVKQVVDGQTTGSGGTLRLGVATAVLRARAKRAEDLFYQSVVENALLSSEQLLEQSWSLQRAIEEDRTSILTGVYDVWSGSFDLLPT